MNLQEFTSDLPKPWLNIKANSIEANDIKADSIEANDIKADTIETKSFKIDQLISGGKVQTVTSSSNTITLNVGVNDVISGVIGFNSTASSGVVACNIILANGLAAALDAALSAYTPPFNFSLDIFANFNVNITSSSLQVTISASDITGFNGENVALVYDPVYFKAVPQQTLNKFYTKLVFARTNSAWILYG